MNTKTTRILKEARPLFWPWCAVAVVGALPLIRPLHSIGWISLFGLFLGIPLLASLSLGNEFQHGTLPLLFSQPVGRMEIWGEKLCVTVVAVLSAVLVFTFAWRLAAFQPELKGVAFPVVWIIATTAAATFWTLFARSTMGGVILNLAVNGFIIAAGTYMADRLRGAGYLSPTNTTFASIVTVLCYAGVMLWLGRRALARFQVTGGMAGEDLLTAGPDVMPGVLAGWLRCRPTGAVLNLIRKEFRLLRPVWLITLLAAVGWICLALYGLMHERGSTISFTSRVPSAKWPEVVWIVGVPSTLIIAMLAGSLSLGEERTSGTHAWHMTLPVLALRQWLIKLFMALLAGLLGAALLPISLLIVVGSLSGSPFKFVDVHFGIFWLLLVALLTFASFWCACAANGTVRAVLLVFPALIALYFAGELGRWAGPAITDLFFSRFDPFANLKFAKAVNAIFDPELYYTFVYADWDSRNSYGLASLTFLWLPTLLLAAGQSYRLFRAQVRESALSLVRNLLPLAMVAFLCSFSLLAFFSFVGRAWDRKSIALFETVQAIEKIQSGAAKLDATHPLQLTVEDLAKASPLSKSTRRILGNSHITLALEEPPHHARYGSGANSQPIYSPYDQGYSRYLATIPLADGSHFTVTFEPGNFLISAGISK